MLKKIWHDPVWSKVIAAAILGLFSLGYFLDFLPVAWGWIKAACLFFIGTTPVWNWLLIPWGIATVAYSSWLALKAYADWRKPWRKYTQDVLHNLRWRWQYDRKGKVTNLKCHCRRCDFEIVPSRPTLNGRISFICNSCNSNFQPSNLGQDWNNQDWQSIITREIYKKIISGEWSQTVKSK